MTREKQRVTIESSYLALKDPTALSTGMLRHIDFPGWRFGLGITGNGDVHHLELVCEENGYAASLDPHATEHTAPGLTARKLREVPLGELRGALLRDLRMHQEHHLDSDAMKAFYLDRFDASTHVQAVHDAFLGTPRPGRQGRPEVEYARTAALYVAELAAGTNPVARLADKVGLSTTQVRSILTEARARDLLTPAPPGHAGGELTEKARRILEQGDD